jgi:hypothetical protein
VETIEQGEQAFFSGKRRNGLLLPKSKKYEAQKEDVRGTLIKRNKKGAYVRPGSEDLDYMCLYTQEGYNGTQVKMHSGQLNEYPPNSPPDPRTTLRGFQLIE